MPNGFSSGILYIKWSVPGIFIAGLVYGTLKGLGTLAEATDANNADHKTGVALALGSITMLVIIVILSISSRNSSSPGRQRLGWASLLLGADGRVSTSKAGVLLWTFGLAYAASFLAGIAGLFQVPVFETSSNSNWTDYLVLLGGPFAAAVLAKAIVLTKSVNGTLAKDVIPGLADPNALGPAAPSGDPVAPEPNANQQPDPAPAQGSNTLPTGLLTNDSGNVDVVDAQYLVFNLVAFLFAAFAFLAQNFDSEIVGPAKYALPQIPAVLLGLTSAAAATYVGNKAIQRSGPRIISVKPSPAGAGAEVTVSGVNLVPPKTSKEVAKSQTVVQLTLPDGTVRVLAPENATAVAVTFVVPDDVVGQVIVAIVTMLGVATDTATLRIA